MIDLTELYCKIDDFHQEFEPEFRKQLLKSGHQRDRQTVMSVSEMMTIMVAFHQSCYRHFKGYYTQHVVPRLASAFPNLLSYNRFIQLLPRILVPLLAYLNRQRGRVTGISFIDSTSLAVCKNKRINRHKVFSGLAARGKTTMGWFYGFKLHLIVNEYGELLSWKLTKGNIDDRKPVRAMTKTIKGKLFGDKGYLSKPLFKDLFERGTQLITTIRKNMKNALMPTLDRILLRKRFIIETINDQLKNISQIEHSRHRSPVNFLVNLVAALTAYQAQKKKPSLNFSSHQLSLEF